MATAERSRRPRGERRRREVLEAALRVIAERGVAATTHRAVAEAAGVPTSSTTYYFDTLDDLLEDALMLFVEEEAARLNALSATLDGQGLPPLEIARLFLAELRIDVAQFELYLEASRRPRLRGAAQRCLDLYAEVSETALRAAGAPGPERYARAFVALLDGYGLHRIAGGGDQGLEDALMALWAAATRAIGTR